jgi:hypothetical protein
MRSNGNNEFEVKNNFENVKTSLLALVQGRRPVRSVAEAV